MRKQRRQRLTRVSALAPRAGGSILLIMLVALSVQGAAGAAEKALGQGRAGAGGAIHGVRLPFVENQGQTDPEIRFYATTPAGTLLVTDEQLIHVLTRGESGEEPIRQETIRERFLGGRGLRPQGRNRSAATIHSFVGARERWRSHIPVFNEVALGEIWPAVEVELRVSAECVEKVFTVHPGGRVEDISIALEQVVALKVTEDEQLLAATSAGPFTMTKPIAFQNVNGHRRPVEASYVIDGNNYGFSVGHYNPDYPLILDPGLVYSTYFGGSGQEFGVRSTVDAAGNVYLAGITRLPIAPVITPDLPVTAGAYDQTFNGVSDVFIAKLNLSGNGIDDLEFATYLGGAANESAGGIAVDAAGNLYVAGDTRSPDFPTTGGAYDTSCGTDGDCNSGSSDAFVVKLDPNGSSLLYGSFLGGSGNDSAGRGVGHIALDGSGAAFIGGFTESSDFPATDGAYDKICGTDGTCNGGASDAFLVKLAPDPSGPTPDPGDLIYGTYLGGSGQDFLTGRRLDPSGGIFISGYTRSTNFPTTAGAYDTTCGTDGSCNGGWLDAFVVKLMPDPAGPTPDPDELVYATYLGGSANDRAHGLAVDLSGNLYIGGFTRSDDFPTSSGAYDTTFNGASDGFVAKLNPGGSGNADLIYSTFLGGSGFDSSPSIAVDLLGNVYAGGATSSEYFFPAVFPGAVSMSLQGTSDVFLAKIDPAVNGISGLLYASYLGGPDPPSTDCAGGCPAGRFEGGGIAHLDILGNVILTGVTHSSAFPTTAGAYAMTASTPPTPYTFSFAEPATEAFVVELATLTEDEQLQLVLDEIKEFIPALQPDDFSNANHQQTLLNKVDSIVALIESASLCELCEAIDSLTDDILPKTDGESPPPDWVTDPAAQSTLESLILALIDLLEAAAEGLGGCGAC